MIGIIAGVVILLVLLVVRPWGGGAIGNDGSDIHNAEVGDFNMIIPLSGELDTAQKTEIRNQLESNAIITSIVDEGSYVNEGDTLFTLSDDALKDRIKDAETKVTDNENNVVAAESNLKIRQSTRDTDLDKADLSIHLAELALKAWEEGEDVSQELTLMVNLETAQKNEARLVRKYEESVKLEEKNYISRDELERDEIAMIEAQTRVKLAEKAIEVYQKYDRVQNRQVKVSDVEQAKAERERIAERHESELNRLDADLESRRKNTERARERLQKLQEQLTYCRTIAPTEGLVVYASSLSESRRNDDPPPQIGTTLRENELVIILPDTSTMVANLKVSEALSGLIEKGQPVTVYSEALPDVPIAGEVQSVSVLAESGGWRDPYRRDYTVRVKMFPEEGLPLKPSMRCRAEILLGQVEQSLHVPIQAIFREGPVAFVYVPDGSGYAQQEVQVGRSSEFEIEITSGLEEGDRVLLREPGPEEIVSKIQIKPQSPGQDKPGWTQGGKVNKPASSPNKGGEMVKKPEQAGSSEGS